MATEISSVKADGSDPLTWLEPGYVLVGEHGDHGYTTIVKRRGKGFQVHVDGEPVQPRRRYYLSSALQVLAEHTGVSEDELELEARTTMARLMEERRTNLRYAVGEMQDSIARLRKLSDEALEQVDAHGRIDLDLQGKIDAATATVQDLAEMCRR